MKYMLIMYQKFIPPDELDAEGEMHKHMQFASLVAERGIPMLDGNALYPAMTATTLDPDGELRQGSFDGQDIFFGGYYIIDVPDLETAQEVAQACPMYEGIEIRQIWEMPSS